MSDKQEFISLNINELLPKVQELKSNGYRLVQIGCTKAPSGLELNYSFDREYNFVNLRLNVTTEDEIPSISGSYWASFIYENEISELFGINITGMSIDFKGTLYKTSVDRPFNCDIK